MPKKLLWVLGRGRCLAIRVNHSAKANPNANARVEGDALLNADAGKSRKDDQWGGRSREVCSIETGVLVASFWDDC